MGMVWASVVLCWHQPPGISDHKRWEQWPICACCVAYISGRLHFVLVICDLTSTTVTSCWFWDASGWKWKGAKGTMHGKYLIVQNKWTPLRHNSGFPGLGKHDRVAYTSIHQWINAHSSEDIFTTYLKSKHRYTPNSRCMLSLDQR